MQCFIALNHFSLFFHTYFGCNFRLSDSYAFSWNSILFEALKQSSQATKPILVEISPWKSVKIWFQIGNNEWSSLNSGISYLSGKISVLADTINLIDWTAVYLYYGRVAMLLLHTRTLFNYMGFRYDMMNSRDTRIIGPRVNHEPWTNSTILFGPNQIHGHVNDGARSKRVEDPLWKLATNCLNRDERDFWFIYYSKRGIDRYPIHIFAWVSCITAHLTNTFRFE